MTNHEKLLRAIGEIDDELIKEAQTPYKRVFTPLTRGLTIAASVVLISAAVLSASDLFLPKAFDNVAGDAAPAPENNSNPGMLNAIKSKYGYIYGIVRDGYKISFEIEIFENYDKDFDIELYGKNKLSGALAICTTTDKTNGYELILSPKITVNGDVQDKLPTSVGIYSVTLDFSDIAETDYTWEEYLIISEFGRIYR